MQQNKSRITQLKKLATAYTRQIKRGEYDDDLGVKLQQTNIEIKRIEAIIRGEQDVAYFAYQYFSDEFNDGNKAGNIIRHSETGKLHETMDEIAPIHRDMYDLCDTVTKKRSGNYVAACPRGHAKTSILSTIFALHQIAYQKRKYILILSETDVLSKKIIASIATQLKYNDKLRRDFGELLSPQSTKNKRDNEDGFELESNILVEASSAGKSLRGRTYNSYRPDAVILDDISSLANENTEDQRQKLIAWFNTVVVPLPSADGAILMIGTKVTASGLLAHLLDRRDFKKLFYSAITSPPSNPSLWSDYLHLYDTETDDQILEDFYADNEAELLDGVELAWPNRWTYRELMHVKSNVGARSFASEYLNESFSSDEQLFTTEDYAYCRTVFDSMNSAAVVYNDKYYRYRDMDIVAAWDVAMAGTARSALNAYITIGRHRDTGLVFILDVYASREVPSVFMERIIERIVEYKPHKVVVEGIGAYSEFHTQLMELARAHRLYSTRIELIKSHGKQSKESRIQSLEVPLANKSLVLNEGHKELIDELRNYPHGRTVDIIDALQIAFKSGSKRKIQIQQKPGWA